MMTSSADFFGNFGCGSTGMPRPLSVTVSQPSLSSSTSMKVGVAGHRLVHGIVDHLGEEVVQRLLVGAADIHAGPAANRLEPLQHLDIGRVVAALVRQCLGEARGETLPSRLSPIAAAAPWLRPLRRDRRRYSS